MQKKLIAMIEDASLLSTLNLEQIARLYIYLTSSLEKLKKKIAEKKEAQSANQPEETVSKNTRELSRIENIRNIVAPLIEGADITRPETFSPGFQKLLIGVHNYAIYLEKYKHYSRQHPEYYMNVNKLVGVAAELLTTKIKLQGQANRFFDKNRSEFCQVFAFGINNDLYISAIKTHTKSSLEVEVSPFQDELKGIPIINPASSNQKTLIPVMKMSHQIDSSQIPQDLQPSQPSHDCSPLLLAVRSEIPQELIPQQDNTPLSLAVRQELIPQGDNTPLSIAVRSEPSHTLQDLQGSPIEFNFANEDDETFLGSIFQDLQFSSFHQKWNDDHQFNPF